MSVYHVRNSGWATATRVIECREWEEGPPGADSFSSSLICENVRFGSWVSSLRTYSDRVQTLFVNQKLKKRIVFHIPRSERGVLNFLSSETVNSILMALLADAPQPLPIVSLGRRSVALIRNESLPKRFGEEIATRTNRYFNNISYVDKVFRFYQSHLTSRPKPIGTLSIRLGSGWGYRVVHLPTGRTQETLEPIGEIGASLADRVSVFAEEVGDWRWTHTNRNEHIFQNDWLRRTIRIVATDEHRSLFRQLNSNTIDSLLTMFLTGDPIRAIDGTAEMNLNHLCEWNREKAPLRANLSWNYQAPSKPVMKSDRFAIRLAEQWKQNQMASIRRVDAFLCSLEFEQHAIQEKAETVITEAYEARLNSLVKRFTLARYKSVRLKEILSLLFSIKGRDINQKGKGVFDALLGRPGFHRWMDALASLDRILLMQIAGQFFLPKDGIEVVSVNGSNIRMNHYFFQHGPYQSALLSLCKEEQNAILVALKLENIV